MRERLIELLKVPIYPKEGVDLAEVVADYLLDNGVIVPPCKVGDTVYYFSHRPFNLSVKANTIYEAKAIRIVTTSLGTQIVIQIRNEYGCTEVPDARDFGKTVFLTREEAEAALKGRESNGRKKA